MPMVFWPSSLSELCTLTTNEIADRWKNDKSFDDQPVGEKGQNVRRYGVAQAQQAQQWKQLESSFEQQQFNPHDQ